MRRWIEHIKSDSRATDDFQDWITRKVNILTIQMQDCLLRGAYPEGTAYAAELKTYQALYRMFQSEIKEHQDQLERNS